MIGTRVLHRTTLLGTNLSSFRIGLRYRLLGDLVLDSKLHLLVEKLTIGGYLNEQQLTGGNTKEMTNILTRTSSVDD